MKKRHRRTTDEFILYSQAAAWEWEQTFWLKNKQKWHMNQAKFDEKFSKKKLTFFAQKTTYNKFSQLYEISIVWKSQEGLERGPD